MLRTLLAFGHNDLKSVRRDSLLLSIALTPWLIVIMLRLAVPSLTAWSYTRYQIRLEDYYPLIVGVFLLLNVPLMFGVMSGFLLLDERDDDTLTALRVTPAALSGLLSYRLLTSALLSWAYMLICLPLTGLVALAQVPRTIPALLLASLFAPIVALALMAFARNKLEGFALLKGVGVVMLGPVAAYFISAGWRLAFGLLPTYWSTQAFWAALNGDMGWGYLLGGFGYCGAALLALWWHLRRTIVR